MKYDFKAGFVNIFGMPNAGKSTLLNGMMGQKLAITSHKVQTTRHRILGILTEPNFQIVFSDTPGIIDPQYKLHQKMMQSVASALQDADVGIIVHDITTPLDDFLKLKEGLKLKVPALLVLNKVDLIDKNKVAEIIEQYQQHSKWEVMAVSANTEEGLQQLKERIVELLPSNPPFYEDEDLSDRPVRFFISELLREEIFLQYHEEIPYHTAVIIQSFEEKKTLTVIKAEIIVSRDTQKMILLGKGGTSIKKLGIAARAKMEEFLEGKVHLEIFVKVRPKWRDNDLYLKEYGYHI